ncbi:pseudoazurin [Hyphomicrobium methylovorum]|uniref:pseudoazurin n=1 Tax=Hyphomicrobium methylovorum TaxID=84 RepID=UPI0015E7900F|nr:pseudoazurin [Hyphomicrobium methylovorum]MBA2127353.1 pseudoazurin [Hyphomicrobium methylovorum]
MKLVYQIAFAGAITLAAAVTTPSLANAAEHVIKMLNKDEAGNKMVFEPAFVKVEVGDTVKFEPTDKGHNAESVPKIWPEGVEQVKGKFSAEVVFKAEKDGLYVFKCLPHYGMGMVALVQVGKPVNLEQVKGFVATGLSKQRFEAELKKVTE